MKSDQETYTINRPRWQHLCVTILLAIAFTVSLPYIAQAQEQVRNPTANTSDSTLVKSLSGFDNGYATVNGVRLHYVSGGEGAPLVLLPGHPETWWGYHKVMLALAKSFRVIVVDIRGMGSSEKSAGGYDKKTMARDIYELIRQLGYEKVNIAGHDIGAMVAFSFAANHPEATAKLALLDVAHPDDSFYDIKMLPEEGKFGKTVDAAHPVYLWWFAFHQVEGLPEKLLAGDGMRLYINWLFNYLLNDPTKIDSRDLAVYGNAYSNPEAIRAGHAWYKAFPRDISDAKTYKKLEMPVLGLGAEFQGYQFLRVVEPKATNFRLVKIENSGHFILIEQPDVISRLLINFFK
ncbi:alpha/beta fold hydrolase [Nostoc sp.]|uniref:alpha/beta fold hydrolase n=1 Tax=Nostoc sp. TaxID=1180 RepID=UPI002FFA40E7